MPMEKEMMLKEEAAKKGMKGKRADAYIYGTMEKKKKERKAKMAKAMMMDKKDMMMK